MEKSADLIQVHVGRAMGLVVGNRLQQAGKKRTAHFGLLGNQRIHEYDRHTATIGGHMDLLEVTRGSKAKSRGLVKTAGTQNLANLARKLLLVRQAANVILGSGDRGLHATHAPQAQNLFDKVNLARKVGTEGSEA